MSKQPKRLTIERVEPVETAKLYGALDDAIAYLRKIKAEHPNATLGENWTGYEDMELSYYWTEPESDEAYATRCNIIEETRQREEAKRREEQSRADKLNKLEAYKKELGL